MFGQNGAVLTGSTLGKTGKDEHQHGWQIERDARSAPKWIAGLFFIGLLLVFRDAPFSAGDQTTGYVGWIGVGIIITGLLLMARHIWRVRRLRFYVSRG